MKPQCNDFIANYQPAGDPHSTCNENSKWSGKRRNKNKKVWFMRTRCCEELNDHLQLQLERPRGAPQGWSTYWVPPSPDQSNTSKSGRSSIQPDEQGTFVNRLYYLRESRLCMFFLLLFFLNVVYLQNIKDNVHNPFHFGLLGCSWFHCKDMKREHFHLIVVSIKRIKKMFEEC